MLKGYAEVWITIISSVWFLWEKTEEESENSPVSPAEEHMYRRTVIEIQDPFDSRPFEATPLLI